MSFSYSIFKIKISDKNIKIDLIHLTNLTKGFIDLSLRCKIKKYSQHYNYDPFLSARDIIITSYNFKILSSKCVLKKKFLQITTKN